MKILKGLIFTTILSSTYAQAAYITLQGYSPSTIRLGGTLTFTYNDSIPDSVQDEYLDGALPSNNVQQIGDYLNAITSATFVSTSGPTAGRVFTLVQGSENKINITRRNHHSKLSVDILLSDGELTDIFHTYNTFGTTASDGLSTLLEPMDFRDDYYWTFLGDMQNFYGEGDRPFKIVSGVPIPASAWLFGSGLLGLIGCINKRKNI